MQGQKRLPQNKQNGKPTGGPHQHSGKWSNGNWAGERAAGTTLSATVSLEPISVRSQETSHRNNLMKRGSAQPQISTAEHSLQRQNSGWGWGWAALAIHSHPARGCVLKPQPEVHSQTSGCIMSPRHIWGWLLILVFLIKTPRTGQTDRSEYPKSIASFINLPNFSYHLGMPSKILFFY